MISKQNLWFLTLFSLILVLSVYYITMPNEVLTSINNGKVITTKKSTGKVSKVEEDYLTVLEIEKDEETGELVKKQDRKELEIILNLGEGYEIKDYLYVEFIDLIYQSVNSVSKKPFDYLGEFKFKIEF